MGSEKAMIDLFGYDVALNHKRDGHLQHWRKEALAFDVYRIDIESTLCLGNRRVTD